MFSQADHIWSYNVRTYCGFSQLCQTVYCGHNSSIFHGGTLLVI